MNQLPCDTTWPQTELPRYIQSLSKPTELFAAAPICLFIARLKFKCLLLIIAYLFQSFATHNPRGYCFAYPTHATHNPRGDLEEDLPT